jgi:hypothetical protein
MWKRGVPNLEILYVNIKICKMLAENYLLLSLAEPLRAGSGSGKKFFFGRMSMTGRAEYLYTKSKDCQLQSALGLL